MAPGAGAAAGGAGGAQASRSSGKLSVPAVVQRIKVRRFIVLADASGMVVALGELFGAFLRRQKDGALLSPCPS